MVFNSFQFLWLFPLIFVVYYSLASLPHIKDCIRHRIENISLILISYGLYMQWKPAYALLLFGITGVTYVGARAADKTGGRKGLVVTCIVLSLLPLFVFKYYNFINGAISGLLASLGLASSMPGLNWAVPVCFSFFS
ncbi:MAG: MBOAT family protein, partial [Porphyromonadaceae bacterium]|nr:MBOAT family protein [Porphyromonadaceae bacterium]